MNSDLRRTCSECEVDIDGSHDDDCSVGMTDKEIHAALNKYQLEPSPPLPSGGLCSGDITGWPVVPNGGDFTATYKGQKRTWRAVMSEDSSLFHREVYRWHRSIDRGAHA